jgi:hypothetical protein
VNLLFESIAEMDFLQKGNQPLNNEFAILGKCCFEEMTKDESFQIDEDHKSQSEFWIFPPEEQR